MFPTEVTEGGIRLRVLLATAVPALAGLLLLAAGVPLAAAVVGVCLAAWLATWWLEAANSIPWEEQL